MKDDETVTSFSMTEKGVKGRLPGDLQAKQRRSKGTERRNCFKLQHEPKTGVEGRLPSGLQPKQAKVAADRQQKNEPSASSPRESCCTVNCS